jgi:hypothetical protein
MCNGEGGYYSSNLDSIKEKIVSLAEGVVRWEEAGKSPAEIADNLDNLLNELHAEAEELREE